MQPGFQSLVKPGYSEKPNEEDEKQSVDGMKPGLLIHPDRDCGPRKKCSHSPSAELLAGDGALCLHSFGAVNEAKNRLFSLMGRGTFHEPADLSRSAWARQHRGN